MDIFTIWFALCGVVLNSCVQPSGKSSQEHYSDCWSTWAAYISALVHTLGTDGHTLGLMKVFPLPLLSGMRLDTHQWPPMLARLYLLYVPMFTQKVVTKLQGHKHILHSLSWSRFQTAFCARWKNESGQLPIPFSFKCTRMLAQLHSALCANDLVAR